MGNYLFLLSIWSDIGDAIASFFFTVLLGLNAIIYSFISYVYQIFLVLAQGGNIIDTQAINGLVSRIYTIIGVIVLFLVAYSLLKNMVNPDEALKGKKSPIKIIRDVIISIVLIAFIPTIFEFAFKVQEAFLTQNTIGKIIAGSTDNGNENTIRTGGYVMAKTVWQAFLVVNDGYCTPEEEIIDESGNFVGPKTDCIPMTTNSGQTYGEMWASADKNTTFWAIRGAAKFIVDDKINYIFVLDILCGAFVLFVLVTYCFDMALRLVKLAVYELIAPLPILSRIIPNENTGKMFNNWIKATLSTFVEVFIRIAILYFAVIIIVTVGSSIDNIFSTASYSNADALPFVISIAKVLVVVGIILFVKQAPQIIKELTGLDGGKYGKSLMKGAGMMFASMGAGATAAIRSFAGDKDKPIMNRFSRALTAGAKGNLRGAWDGRKTDKISDIPKNAGKAASSTLGSRARIEAAGGRLNYMKQYGTDKFELAKDWVGGATGALKSEKNASDKILKVVNNVKATAEDYIDKHSYEYYANANVQRAIDTTKEELEKARKEGNQSEIARLETELKAYEQGNSHLRLDVIKARSEDMNISAEERANALNLYNKSRKSSVDRFATDVHHHVGAEKESAQVKMEIQTMSEIIKENQASLAVQNLQKGNATYNLEAFNQPLNNDTAGEFFKAAKAAAEFANIENQAKLNEQERREERRKASSSSNDGKGK